MRRVFFLLVCLACLNGLLLAQTKQPVDYVDTRIARSDVFRWNIYPGATTPYGMVSLSPDNIDAPDMWYKGGYNYNIKNIAGFSHIHAWSMAGLLTMPTVGELKTDPGPQNEPGKGYRSRWSNDIAKPGYYAVTLDDYNIKAELTATTRCGFNRYTFPKSDCAHILFDLKFLSEYSYNIVRAHVKKS
jgi:putative alpha-1,2-mannosidase